MNSDFDAIGDSRSIGNSKSISEEELLDGALDALTSHVAILDSNGDIVSVNKPWQDFARANGYRGSSLGIGSNYLSVTHAAANVTQDALQAFHGIQSVLSGEERYFRMEYPCHSPSEQRWFQMTVTKFNKCGRSFAVVAHDNVTPRRLAEIQLQQLNTSLREAQAKAEAATKAKSLFLANMCHEIRTPMTAIMGFAQLLQESQAEVAASPDCVEYCDTIHRNSVHLLSLLNDILDLSKIEAERLDLEEIAFDPAALLQEVASMVRPKAESQGLNFLSEADQSIPEQIISDPTRVRQVLLNLLSNAVKFTEQGEVRLQASYRNEGNVVEFVVSDTGIGIAKEHLESLFEPFAQADASISRRYGGSGLGLQICKRLSSMLGGELRIESEPDVGSVFRFILPVGHRRSSTASMPRTQACFDHERGDDRTIALTGIRVLLVEDGIDNQKLISHLLTRSGASVAIASNGKEAIEMLTNDKSLEGELVPARLSI